MATPQFREGRMSEYSNNRRAGFANRLRLNQGRPKKSVAKRYEDSQFNAAVRVIEKRRESTSRRFGLTAFLIRPQDTLLNPWNSMWLVATPPNSTSMLPLDVDFVVLVTPPIADTTIVPSRGV